MQQMTRTGRAGDSAEQRYRYLYRAWLRRVWPVLAAIGALGATSGVVGLLVGGGWSWGFGFVGGLFVGVLLWILANPPTRILNWQWGSEGERRTAKRLRSLNAERWRVWHDLVRVSGTNVDHVVAGPGGVFVLDTKEWTGVLSISDGRLNVQWREDPAVNKPYDLQSTAHTAVELHNLLLSRAHVETYVQAVVVIWGDFAQRKEKVKDVWFVHGDELVAWLEEQPHKRVFLPRVTQCLDEAWANGLA